MRNFQKLAVGIETSQLLQQLASQPELWNKFPVRTAHPRSNHQTVDDVILRYNPFDVGDDYIERVCANIDCVNYWPWSKLPLAVELLHGIMGRVRGLHLGRCVISRMAPGGEIPLHSDRIPEAEELYPQRIPPAVYYERYQMQLSSLPGTVFQCGDESVHMATGELWWFNNQLPHRVVNGSADDRLALVVDIRTAGDDYWPLGVEPT